MAEIVFENVTKVFPGDVIALDGVSLKVADGEFIALVGPSGCGSRRCFAHSPGWRR